MFKTFSRGFVVVIGLLWIPGSLGFAQQPRPSTPAKEDPRLHVLENFFAARHCPVRSMAADFLIAADKNRLDWRLLPSISFVESGGGKHNRNNNIFGWNSGRHRFSSIRESIYITAAKLSQMKVYRNKNTAEILQVYNKHPEWREKIKAVMRSIGSEEIPAAVAALN